MIYRMRFLALLALLALPGCDRSDARTGVPAAPETPTEVDMLEFGKFDYVERMKLPDPVLRWNGKRVRTTGYMNPRREIRNLKEFELVMNKDSCCYGSRPKMNHFFQVEMKPGSTTVFTSDPVMVVGRLVVEERWDGDWPTGLYWLKDAQVMK